MKILATIMTLLLTVSAFATSGSRPAILNSHNLLCDETFQVKNFETDFLFTISGPVDPFGREIFQDVEFESHTSCTPELLGEIRMESGISFGFIPASVKAELLSDGHTQVTIVVFPGPHRIEFSGIKLLN